MHSKTDGYPAQSIPHITKNQKINEYKTKIKTDEHRKRKKLGYKSGMKRYCKGWSDGWWQGQDDDVSDLATIRRSHVDILARYQNI